MSADQKHVVVVGAGHSASQLCVSLRQAKWPGKITVLGDEQHIPYHRPPLSKTYLAPESTESIQPIRPSSFYDDNSIELLLGHRVDSIDRSEKTVHFDDQSIDYDLLVLATGSTHRRPPISGIDHARVVTLQTAEHADAVRDMIRGNSSVVVIGAGFIGLEVASSLRKLGINVVVLERMDRVLSRVTSPQVSDYFAALHRSHGVDLRLNVNVVGVSEVENKLHVEVETGDPLIADFVVVGAGAAPNDQLAKLAGLAVDNGIAVNEFNQTEDPSIYAMGDCCNQFQSLYKTRMRLESVQNALDQAKTVALAIRDQARPHTALPWFWSDQYDVKFQTAGISAGYDECIVRGTAEIGQPFSVWYLKDGSLIAVDAINDSRSYAVASKLIPVGQCPKLELISDSNVDAKTLLQSAKEAKEDA